MQGTRNYISWKKTRFVQQSYHTKRNFTSGQVSSKVGDLSPTDLSQQLASRRKNFPDKSGLLSTLTPATALPFPSTHSFILHWVVFFGRMQDTTAALYLKNISYHR